MENKYYTPTIEEFHVGFEFETCYLEKEWITKKLTFDDFGFYTSTWEVDSTPKTEFRVKYLDQEDIESLGFVLKGKSIDLWFQREGIYLRDDGHHLKNIMLQYGTHDQRLRITFLYTSGEEQIHFEGKIKNKSELKKLIKQLEIEQDGRM